MVRPAILQIANENSTFDLLNLQLQCFSLLRCSSSIKHLSQIHARLQTSSLHKSPTVLTNLLRFCISSSSVADLKYASRLLHYFQPHSSHPFHFNILIKSHFQAKSPKEAISLYRRMRTLQIAPNEYTLPYLLNSCAALSALEAGRSVHVDAIKHFLDSDINTQNSLIYFYGHCGCIPDARKVFDRMSYKEIVSWNSIITAYIRNSLFDNGTVLFRMMPLHPNAITFVLMLSGCTHACKLISGRQIHGMVIVRGIIIGCELGSALVDMYSKCGALGPARKVFTSLEQKTPHSWSTMVVGLARHGFGHEAIRLFLEMKNSSLFSPDPVSFLCVLCACRDAGFVNDACKYFREMENLYKMKPRMEHYGVMVDILCKGGHLQEAFDFVKSVPSKAGSVLWSGLLRACNAEGDHDLASRARKELLELEPGNGGSLVTVANTYAEVGMWEKSAEVRGFRTRMKRFLGTSSIEES